MFIFILSVLCLCSKVHRNTLFLLSLTILNIPDYCAFGYWGIFVENMDMNYKEYFDLVKDRCYASSVTKNTLSIIHKNESNCLCHIKDGKFLITPYSADDDIGEGAGGSIEPKSFADLELSLCGFMNYSEMTKYSLDWWFDKGGREDFQKSFNEYKRNNP